MRNLRTAKHHFGGRCKRPCCVGETLQTEVAHVLLCSFCQCCEERYITLACRCKRPCCVGELLRIDVANEPCSCSQCCEQRCIILACCCKRPSCICELLRLEVAHEPFCSLHQCCRKYVEQPIASTMRCSICYVGKCLRSKFARARHLQGVLYQGFQSTTQPRSQAKLKWLVLHKKWLEPKGPQTLNIRA